VIDEAAAIPLTIVKALLGERLTFMSSTVNGYEGTGRALSLKLIKDLRDSKTRGGAAISTNESEKLSVKSSSKKRGEAKVHEQRWEAAANAAAAAMGGASGKFALVEIELASPIRYSQGDPIESWLNKLLCLDWYVLTRLNSFITKPIFIVHLHSPPVTTLFNLVSG
jgi:N-acetyltransferase 10